MKNDIDYILRLARPALLKLKPYSSARDEFDNTVGDDFGWTFLDANENPYATPYSRYPDPHQRALKEKLAAIRGVDPSKVFVGNGSDEVIDLICRLFCRPGIDNILVPVPTYGMYEVSAAINEVDVRKVSLAEGFDIDVAATMAAVDNNTKVLFLCSPNNPTGNLLSTAAIDQLLDSFPGVILIDEAYIDFANARSYATRLEEHKNLVVMQTLSKAWGLAGLRLGFAFADAALVKCLDRIKPPYNVSSATQDLALKCLEHPGLKERWVASVLGERERVTRALTNSPSVEQVFPSDANFILVRIEQASSVYRYLIEKRIVVRDRSQVLLCEGCLRITIGTPSENDKLLAAIASL